jgi:hypothetical protein
MRVICSMRLHLRRRVLGWIAQAYFGKPVLEAPEPEQPGRPEPVHYAIGPAPEPLCGSIGVVRSVTVQPDEVTCHACVRRLADVGLR